MNKNLTIITTSECAYTATPIDSWILMTSPAPLIMTFAFYLIFVLNIGPRYMKNRKPFKLANFIRCYNVFQVIACTFFVEWAVNRGTTYRSTWKCTENKIDPRDIADLSVTTWYFLTLRMIEFSETVVFVLRKKQNQVSALHIYHHMSTVVLLWIFLKYSPDNEMGIYICALNSFVHVIMYTYYLLSSYANVRDRLKPIKPFITIIQLSQLGLILGHSIIALLPSCAASKLFYFQVANGIILIGFFSKFYVDSYSKRSKKQA